MYWDDQLTVWFNFIYWIRKKLSNTIIKRIWLTSNSFFLLVAFFFFWSTRFIFSFTIPPAIRCIHAQKRGMPLLSGLKFHVYIFIRTFAKLRLHYFYHRTKVRRYKMGLPYGISPCLIQVLLPRYLTTLKWLKSTLNTLPNYFKVLKDHFKLLQNHILVVDQPL